MILKSGNNIYHDNDINDTAIIEPGCIIGENNHIGAYCVIEGNVWIGDNNWIGPLVTIGQPGEYRNKDVKGKVIIGSGNIIREHTAVQASVLTEATVIGNNTMVMEKCHIAHDCKVGDNVNIAPLSSLGGSAIVESDANLGQGVIIHPRLKVGRGAMVGMNATVTKDIPEFEVWAGSPARYMRPNHKAMNK